MRTINRHVRLLLHFYVAPPFTNQGWGVEEEAERGSRSGQAWRGGDRHGGDREGLNRCSPAPGRTHLDNSGPQAWWSGYQEFTRQV